MASATVSSGIEQPPVFVRVEVSETSPMRIVFVPSGTIPESGTPRYRTAAPGKATVRLHMLRAIGLVVRWHDGGPLFETGWVMPFETARKTHYATGANLPIYYDPPRTSEPAYFTSTFVGWNAIDRVETIQLAGQNEARLSYPAQRLITIAAGGLIGRSGSRRLPRLEADGMTFRFEEPVYGTLHVRYQSEYQEWTLAWSMPDAWYARKSSANPALSNNDRLARRLMAADEMKPILLCVDVPPGAGNLPEDRQWHTAWVQLIERAYHANLDDEYDALKSAVSWLRANPAHSDNLPTVIADWVDGKTLYRLSYMGVRVRSLGLGQKVYLRSRYLGRKLESRSVALSNVMLPNLGSANPLMEDVAVHCTCDAVLVTNSPLYLASQLKESEDENLTSHYWQYHAWESAPLTHRYYAFSRPAGPSPTMTFEAMHDIFIARCAAYGIDTHGITNAPVFYRTGLPGVLPLPAGPMLTDVSYRTLYVLPFVTTAKPYWKYGEGAMTDAEAAAWAAEQAATGRRTVGLEWSQRFNLTILWDGGPIGSANTSEYYTGSFVLFPYFRIDAHGQFTPGEGQEMMPAAWEPFAEVN